MKNDPEDSPARRALRSIAGSDDKTLQEIWAEEERRRQAMQMPQVQPRQERRPLGPRQPLQPLFPTGMGRY